MQNQTSRPALTGAQIQLAMAEKYRAILADHYPKPTALLTADLVLSELRCQVANQTRKIDFVMPHTRQFRRFRKRLQCGVALFLLLFWTLVILNLL